MPCPRERLAWSLNFAAVNDHLDFFLERDCLWIYQGLNISFHTYKLWLYPACIPVNMWADGTTPHLWIPLVGVKVSLGSAVDENTSHMASSKPQKRSIADDALSDEENTPTMNFWLHFLLIQYSHQEKTLSSLSPLAIAKCKGLWGTP